MYKQLLAVMALSTGFVAGSLCSVIANNDNAPTTQQAEKIANSAWAKIQEAQLNTSGNVERAICTLVPGQKEMKVKLHFTDYHKKPETQMFPADINTTQEVTVTHVAHNKSELGVVFKDANKRTLTLPLNA
jgi:hypothetical protein